MNRILPATRRAVLALTLAGPAMPLARAGIGEISEGKATLHVYFTYREADPRTWDTVMTAFSQLLHDALDGQLQVGTIKYYNGCSQAKDGADIWVLESATAGAYANLSGLGVRGRHITISNRHKSNTAAARGPFGLVHESGHYIFGLRDEYGGQIRIGDAAGDLAALPAGAYMFNNGNLGLNAANKIFYCAERSGGTSCIMDGGTTVTSANSRTEFCWSGNHVAPGSGNIPGYAGTYWWATQQQFQLGMCCWDHLNGQYGITKPAGAPTDAAPAGHQALAFEVVDAIGRLALCLDRSGSMSGTPLEQAKQGARMFVNLVQTRREVNGVTIPGDHLAVVQFATSAQTLVSMAEVTSDAVRAAARAAISGITSTGMTTIGGGLQRSLSEITGGGTNEPGCSEIIILLSDGYENTSPYVASVLPSVTARKAKVYTIGLGSGVDVGLMQGIASATGGRFFYASSAFDLAMIYLAIWAELDSAGAVVHHEDSVSDEAEAVREVYVDAFTQQMTFSMQSGWAGVEFTLTDPNGRAIDAAVADTDASITYLDDGVQKLFRVETPVPGLWQMNAAMPSSGTDQTATGNSSPNLAILDHTTVTDTITIAEDFVLGSVAVPISLTHTYIGDLHVVLTSPQGTSVVLHNHSAGGTDNLIGTYGVDLTPAEDLATLVGESSAGTWTLQVSDEASGDTGTLGSWGVLLSTGATPPPGVTSVRFDGFATTPTLQISAETSSTAYTYPAPVRISTRVVAGVPVLNTLVTAQVDRPDGTSVDIDLFDDGHANHGDESANDGTYSALFSAYSGNGVYKFQVRVDNTTGVYMLPNEEDPAAVPESVPPFSRTVSQSVSVTGAPVVDQVNLRVDSLGVKLKPTATGADGLSIKGKFDATLDTVNPETDTFALAIGGRTISFAPGELTRSGSGYRYRGSRTEGDTAVALKLDLFRKGTSQCVYAAKLGKADLAGQINTLAPIPVALAYGGANAMITLRATPLGENGEKGAAYRFTGNDLVAGDFYVSAFGARVLGDTAPNPGSISPESAPNDAMALTASFPGFGAIDPDTQTIAITVGSVTFTFAPGTLVAAGKGWSFKGPLDTAVVSLKLSPEKRMFQMKASGLDLSDLSNPATLGFTVGGLAANSSLVLGRTAKGTTVTYTYR